MPTSDPLRTYVIRVYLLTYLLTYLPGSGSRSRKS